MHSKALYSLCLIFASQYAKSASSSEIIRSGINLFGFSHNPFQSNLVTLWKEFNYNPVCTLEDEFKMASDAFYVVTRVVRDKIRAAQTSLAGLLWL